MRLLERDDTGEFRLTKYLPSDEIPPYAILSHTWGDEEVLYNDIADGMGKNKAGYDKIQFCGDQAWRDGLKYFWVDTCCIDKSDAAELQLALNSMFRWYRSAAKCYVFLADVSAHQEGDGPGDKPDIRQSKWFTRGWTLQELIAPTIVEFFSEEGERLGDKKSLEKEIHDRTGIPLNALQGVALSNFSIDERMKWIEKRKTKFEEDKAYSLFGIFDVHIEVLYGEGEHKAFDRLREKISKDSHRIARLWATDPRDPRHEKERIELAKGGLLADAYRWVFNNPDFKRWRELPESRLLWIKGNPGKGKTMLLCGIIDGLEQAVRADSHNLAYFFCQATDSRINNATAVLRGLIYLLTCWQPRLLLYLPENTYASDDAMAWVVLSKALFKILEDPNLKITYLVIDALDECVIDQPKLLSLIVQISSVSARVRLIASSRNWVQIEKQLAAITQQSKLSLELNAESVTAAVEAFIQHKVLHLSRLKCYDEATENAVHHYLASNADGTFLWVALVCQALADPNLRRWQTLDKLHAFPPGLDSLYAQMMKHIDNSDNADLCKRALATATIVRRPISLYELITLIEMPNDIKENPQYLEELIRLCGSFLTLREQIIYFVHQSAKDFLEGKAVHQASREPFNQIFPRGTEVVNRTVFSRSLNAMSTVLRRDIYGLKAPGFRIDEVQTPFPDPLHMVRYSCVFWVDHLCDSISDKNIMQRNIQDAIQSFLEQKYLYWLEALSLLRAMSEDVIAIRRLESLLDRNAHPFTSIYKSISSRLSKKILKINRKPPTAESQINRDTDRGLLVDLVRNAHRFALSCRSIVEEAPLQAYLSALVFALTRSLIRKRFKAEEPYWISTALAVEAEWNACLETLKGYSD
ncbi:NACHT domain-containing protein [Cladorrhinum sp. PSN259]|nr:NACHT domain-containing protein [Cladorrhinum sp. PSN259]